LPHEIFQTRQNTAKHGQTLCGNKLDRGLDLIATQTTFARNWKHPTTLEKGQDDLESGLGNFGLKKICCFYCFNMATPTTGLQNIPRASLCGSKELSS
jgi:hypothetical protein